MLAQHRIELYFPWILVIDTVLFKGFKGLLADLCKKDAILDGEYQSVQNSYELIEVRVPKITELLLKHKSVSFKTESENGMIEFFFKDR